MPFALISLLVDGEKKTKENYESVIYNLNNTLEHKITKNNNKQAAYVIFVRM